MTLLFFHIAARATNTRKYFRRNGKGCSNFFLSLPTFYHSLRENLLSLNIPLFSLMVTVISTKGKAVP